MKMKQQDFKINFKLAKLYLSKLISNISIPCSDGRITINQNSPKEIFLEENQYDDFQYVILWYCLFYVTFSVYAGSKSIFSFPFYLGSAVYILVLHGDHLK